MNNAVGRLSHALDASREEQGLCPHVKNPAFDAGLVFLPFCDFITEGPSQNEYNTVKDKFRRQRKGEQSWQKS